MGARFLDQEARAAFKQSIETIESASGVEIVIAVRRKSAGYLHANLIVGILATFIGLAAMLFSDHPFGLVAILADPFIVGALAAAAVHVLPGVKRILTPPSVRHRYVTLAAHATFIERGVHNTMDRSGMLIYISWLEQQIAVVADSGLARSITPETIGAIERELNAAMPRGGAAVARALETWKTQLGVAVPRRASDQNELPDDIHTDMEDHA